MPLRDSLSNTWSHIQGFLFPMLRDEVGPLTDKQKQVVVVLDVARIEPFVHMWPGLQGCPPVALDYNAISIGSCQHLINTHKSPHERMQDFYDPEQRQNDPVLGGATNWNFVRFRRR
jgi:hypothetical protein